MRRRAFALAAGLCLPAAGHTATGQAAYPGADWDSVLRSDGRWDRQRLQQIGAFVDSLGSGAVVVVHEGRLVAAWGDARRRFPLTSVRKSLLHALIGREVERGTIRLDATLAELGIDDDPPLTEGERAARVSDLLASRSGVYHPAAYEPSGIRGRRPGTPERGSAAPGARWFYNNWDFNALGTIYEQRSGTSIFQSFEAQIARPIGMQDFRAADGTYVREPVSRHPGYTFRISARDLARFGLLYLRRGRWGDAVVVPERWVEDGTRPHSDAGSDGSYGLLWWAARDGGLVPGVSIGAGAFAARGNGPHYMVVIPERQLVIVHLADTETPSPERWVERTDVGRLIERVLAALR